MPFFITFFLSSSRHFSLCLQITVSGISLTEMLLVFIPCRPLKKCLHVGAVLLSPWPPPPFMSGSAWRLCSASGAVLQIQGPPDTDGKEGLTERGQAPSSGTRRRNHCCPPGSEHWGGKDPLPGEGRVHRPSWEGDGQQMASRGTQRIRALIF